MVERKKSNFWRIFSGITLAGIGVVIIGTFNNNIWALLLGVIFIASGIGILLKD